VSGDRQGSKDLVAAVQTCHASPERAKPASIHQVKPWLAQCAPQAARGRPAFGDACLSQTLLSQIVFGNGAKWCNERIAVPWQTSSRVKLNRAAPSQSAPSLSVSEGKAHLYAAFLPIEMKPGLSAFCRGLLPPANGEMPIRLLKCAVLDRVGYELV